MRRQPRSRRAAGAPGAHRFAARSEPYGTAAVRETAMTIRKVGPNSTYPTITAALAESAAGDTIRLESGYGYKRAVLTVQDLIVQGDASSVYIELRLGAGINDVTLAGLA